MDVPKFLAIFPEFSDLDLYPEEKITFWLDYSTHFVNTARFKQLTDTAIALVCAHQLTLANMNGRVQGNVTGSSVDSVSESYDLSAIQKERSGHWNLTMYGLQYIQLVKLYGAGPAQISY